jgi:glycosyltransferase involved in cell wall biosynthesis
VAGPPGEATFPVRILQVVPRYAPAWAFGGGVRITYELARQWVRCGHQVTVYTSDQSTETERFPFADDEIDGIKVRRFPLPPGTLVSRIPLLGFWPRGMAQALKQTAGKFDIAHIAEARGMHVMWTRQGSRHAALPYAWSAYGGLAQGTGVRQLYRRMNDQVLDTTRLVQEAASLIAQTDHEARIYKSFGATDAQIRVIPLGINWEDFAQLPRRGQFRRKLGLNDDARLVLFLGRIHQTKGIDLLVDAFARVSAQVEGCMLAIVGWDHGFRSALERQVARVHLQDRVVFSAPLYGADRLAAYVDADVFAVTPRVYEETSLAALEACACGTTCVITSQCEIPGVEEAGIGRVVNCTTEEIAEALVATLQITPSEPRRAAIRDFVRTRFSSSQIAADYIAAFEAGVARSEGLA